MASARSANEYFATVYSPFAPVSLQPPGQLPMPLWFALKSVDAYSPLPINRTGEPSPGGNEINGEFLGHISVFGSRELAKWCFHIVFSKRPMRSMIVVIDGV